MLHILGNETIYELLDAPGLVHSSSQISFDDDSLICVWYEGSYETSADTVIKMAQKSPSGTWSEAHTIIDLKGAPLGNPVLWKTTKDPRIFITFSVLTAEDWRSSLLFVTSSEDRGKTWKDPTLFLSKLGFMGKTQPIENEYGEIIFPLYHEADYCPYTYLIKNVDDFLSSALTAETMARGKAIQPALCTLKNNRILMATRTRMGYIWKSVSQNAGYSWSILQPTTLENPDSGIDLFNTDTTTIGVVYNPSKTSRNSLAVAVSKNDGDTWEPIGELLSGNGEYSYPCVLNHGGNVFSVTYTESRYAIRRITFEVRE
ncbi:MAG: exo-alpha-sialidase [Spirochaetota bacterium]|nr:exo-alpha-sialidase [Spirochaetota bacterium]